MAPVLGGEQLSEDEENENEVKDSGESCSLKGFLEGLKETDEDYDQLEPKKGEPDTIVLHGISRNSLFSVVVSLSTVISASLHVPTSECGRSHARSAALTGADPLREQFMSRQLVRGCASQR